jgi:hypothetical protein
MKRVKHVYTIINAKCLGTFLDIASSSLLSKVKRKSSARCANNTREQAPVLKVLCESARLPISRHFAVAGSRDGRRIGRVDPVSPVIHLITHSGSLISSLAD